MIAANKSNFNSIDYRDQGKLRELSRNVMVRIDDLVQYLGLELAQDRNRYYGPCPVHGGDNPMAMSLYYNDDGIGSWCCYSQHCEHTFVSSIIGFVRGVLSKQKHGWEGKGDPVVGFNDTITFLLDFLKKDFNELKNNSIDLEKSRFINCVNDVYTVERPQQQGPSRNIVRESLQRPAQYYINRGYSQEILDQYDVGLCTTKDKPMYNRVVVPIYDDSHTHMVACTGRSIYEQCTKCYCFHPKEPGCPSEDRKKYYPKWKHSKGFQGDRYLYNYWRAKKHIKKTKTAILVESPGNVWRLEEAGIHNAVGLFGTSLSNGQRMLLDGSGAMSLILIMDNDGAGQLAQQKIRQQCEMIYKINEYHTPESHNDLGSMTVDDILVGLQPLIDKVTKELIW